MGYLSKVFKYCFDEPQVNFERLSDMMCDGKERLRTYVYDCLPYQDDPPTDEQRRRYLRHNRFLATLGKLRRFDIRLGRLAYDRHAGEFVQKMVDVLMSVDLVRMSWGRQIGTAVLVTGDSDLVPAVLAAKDAGVVTVLYHADCHDENGHARTRAHSRLMEVCDECRVIDDELIQSALR